MSASIGKRLLIVGAATLVAVSGVTAPAWAGGSRPSPGSPGLGDRLYPLLGNGGYDVQHYDLSLRYAKKDPKQTVSGDVTITAVATQSLSRFDLDFGGDSVARVSVDGRPAHFTRNGGELVVTPRHYLPKRHRFTVTVNGFTATPIEANADSPVGFVTTQDGTVLAGQPDSSHMLFPSNDHPRDKATYTITLTEPVGWTGTANGVLVANRVRHGYVSSTYRETQPMASELVQVVVGDFVVQRSPSINGTAIRDVVPRRLASTLLPRAAQERSQVAWVESKVGRYPFEDYGSLVIDADLGFALETQTLSLYDTGLFGAPEYVLGPVMTHELTHQWFGDSVAPWSWSDVWQNEGHATWYELLYSEETGGFQQYTGYPNREAYFKAVYAAGDEFRAGFGPVAAPLDSTSVWDVFNPNVYDGGALVLYALQQKIGVAKFQQVERDWVSVYRGKSASSQDFEALASKVAHQNLRPFLNQWLYGTSTPPMPGHPDWTVTPVPSSAAASTLAAPVDPAAQHHQYFAPTGK
jgi:aminopeptidase N